ncbi:hypothetical protein VIGAN_03285700 [Vigna angularis var. angularis]|uniref:Uncharacterized protein n=1 Tax=Vigna angularis var. angularis TaxID=157739 RepID=A0A0S3RQA0_PHAAN|nr:hypothetical protein VIGAN_03285700 [Vigna angularis var. angularis]
MKRFGLSTGRVKLRGLVEVRFWRRQTKFQGFNWKSHEQHQKLWNFLGTKIPEIAKSGFSSVWLPPSYDSFSPEEDELRTLLHNKMKQRT